VWEVALHGTTEVVKPFLLWMVLLKLELKDFLLF